jgi:hypothetical protein
MNKHWPKIFSVALIFAMVLSILSLAQSARASGTISLTTFGNAYTEDFNTLASSGTTNTIVPVGWNFFETGTSSNAFYRAGTGSDNSGDTYSFGATGDTDRAFGGLRSGSLVPLVGAQFSNNTGGTITELAIAYTGEQWRLGQNTAGRAADRLDFQFSTDANSLSTGTWTDFDSLDFSSPVVVGTNGALNGNVSPNRTALSSTISGLNIPNGASFWIRWADTDLIPGADDGLSVDDFLLTPKGFIPASPLSISDVSANEGNSGTTTFTFTVSLSSPAGAGGVSFDIATADNSAISPDDFTSKSLTGQTIPAGSSNYTFDVLVNGDTTPEADETFFVNVSNVTGADIVDGQGQGTILNDDSFCALPYTPIYDIQGSGATVAMPGSQTTQGVVVGDYEGPSPALRGFFIQDPSGDGNPATSDGIFVFEGNNANTVNLGDVVRVTGNAHETQGQSEISVGTIINCGTGSVTPTDVTFPVASADSLEQYEGMLVRLPQTMYVTEHFQLGRFGQVVLSVDGKLKQPTNVVAPGAPALALQAQNNLSKIILDDASQAQNPDPILFARGGQPLSASNTLRGGDTATGIIGVLNYTWAGNSASPNAYRIRPTNALNGFVNFEPTNPRPTTPPAVGGNIKVVGMNLLNFFNTFDGLPDTVDNCNNGVGGPATDCRGADTQSEFDRQWPKTVAAILAMNPDVVGVNELENDGYGPDSSLQFLVDKLNAATAPGTYAFINVDANTGQTNAMGTDAIRVAMLYKPAVVTPVGQTAALNSVAFVNGGDSAPRSRPSLAQAFKLNSTGAVFIADINHLKSKGSACDTPDAGDGQGNCNQARVNAATALMNWFATDPTGTGDPDILLLGDYNSYAKEDPITVIKNAGFTNLIESLLGPDAYSYVFDGQWGYLDHALGSASMTGQVTGVAEYHINSDEPSVLDYNTDFKTANLQNVLYAPDQYRISDHDPVIVGLHLNAAPTVTASFAMTSISCGPSNATLNVSFSDPDAADTHSALIDWGDGHTQPVDPATSPFSLQHTFALAGKYTATVTVTDNYGGAGKATANTTVNFNTSGFLPPLDPNGSSVFKYKSTIPVQIIFTDCDGSLPSTLAPTIKVTKLSGTTPALDINEPISTSAADTSGVMRFSNNLYIYNLATKPLPDPSATYQITVTVPLTGQQVTVKFGLKP